jgi:hypothetical protein
MKVFQPMYIGRMPMPPRNQGVDYRSCSPKLMLLAPKGKCRTLVMGMHFTIRAGCCVLLAAGVAALLTGQPYGIWYGLGYPGLLGLLLFGPLTWVIRKRYTEAELHKSMAEDL